MSGVGVGSDPRWGPSPSLFPRAAAQAFLRSALSPSPDPGPSWGCGDTGSEMPHTWGACGQALMWVLSLQRTSGNLREAQTHFLGTEPSLE